MIVPIGFKGNCRLSGDRRHPPTLSKTERRRFLRAYYFVVGLAMHSDESVWVEHLRKLSYRDLYIVHEMFVSHVFPLSLFSN